MNFAPVVKFGSKMLLKLRKHAPAIMTGAGIVLGGACVVTACVQTTKLPETVRENKERIEELHSEEMTVHNAPEGSQEPRRASELRKEYISMAGKAVRLYAVPAALGALSVACTIGGHKVLTKENAALASAYIALDKSFKAYKEKMPLPKTETITDSEGNEFEAPTAVVNSNLISPYARFFDCGNVNWCKNPEATLMFLKATQNWCNDMLHSRGHLFLNEVYDELGIPRSEAGQYVGWVDGIGDSCVDFGIFDKNNAASRAFVNGYEEAVLLDFNVDGPIMYLFENLGKE